MSIAQWHKSLMGPDTVVDNIDIVVLDTEVDSDIVVLDTVDVGIVPLDTMVDRDIVMLDTVDVGIETAGIPLRCMNLVAEPKVLLAELMLLVEVSLVMILESLAYQLGMMFWVV
jgi:hypothetical protein